MRRLMASAKQWVLVWVAGRGVCTMREQNTLGKGLACAAQRMRRAAACACRNPPLTQEHTPQSRGGGGTYHQPPDQTRRTFFRDLNKSSCSICWSVVMLKSSALLLSECGTGMLRVFGRVKPAPGLCFGDCFPWAIDGSHTGDSGTGGSTPRPFSRSVPCMATGRADYVELRCCMRAVACTTQKRSQARSALLQGSLMRF